VAIAIAIALASNLKLRQQCFENYYQGVINRTLGKLHMTWGLLHLKAQINISMCYDF
jgi:hypothetical protein